MADKASENADTLDINMTPLEKAPDPGLPDDIIAKERYTDRRFHAPGVGAHVDEDLAAGLHGAGPSRAR